MDVWKNTGTNNITYLLLLQKKWTWKYIAVNFDWNCDCGGIELIRESSSRDKKNRYNSTSEYIYDVDRGETKYV